MFSRSRHSKKSLGKEESLCVIVDPLWEDKSPHNVVIAVKRAMERIVDLPEDDPRGSVIGVWSTPGRVSYASGIVTSFKHRVEDTLVWVKSRGGRLRSSSGSIFKSSHEILVVGVRGDPRLGDKIFRMPSVAVCEDKRDSYCHIEATIDGPWISLSHSDSMVCGWRNMKI